MKKIYLLALSLLLIMFLGACSSESALRAVPKPVNHSFDQPINEPSESEEFFNLYVLEARKQGKYEPANFFIGESLPVVQREDQETLAYEPLQRREIMEPDNPIVLCQITTKLEEAFPQNAILTGLARGQTPLVILQASESVSLADMEKRAGEAAIFQVPMFILFQADKLMSPQVYKEIFITMRDIFLATAPHVAFIWGIDLKDMGSMAYYPGDAWVDWVGFFLRESIVHLDMGETPYEPYESSLESFMSQISVAKPIMAFYGVSHHSTQNNRYYIEEAIGALDTFIQKLDNYPNVKGVVFQLEDTPQDRYNIYDNEMMKKRYFELIQGLGGDTTLTKEETIDAYRLSDFLVWKVSDSFYIPTGAIRQEFNITNSLPVRMINQEPMVAFYDIKKYIDFDFTENKERQKVFLWKDNVNQ